VCSLVLVGLVALEGLQTLSVPFYPFIPANLYTTMSDMEALTESLQDLNPSSRPGSPKKRRGGSGAKRDPASRARQEIESVDREFLHAIPRNGIVVDGVLYQDPVPPHHAHAAMGCVIVGST